MKRAELLSAYAKLTPDIERAEAFVALAGDEALTNCPSVGLAIIAPESFGLGVAGPLLRRIAGEGWQLRALEVRQLAAEDASAMFVPGWVPERFRWWMIQRRFELGPSAFLVLTRPGIPDAGAALGARKGHRIPALAKDDTWRGSFPSINGVLDLVHTSDDFPYVLRNSLPAIDVATLVRVVADPDDAAGSSLSIDDAVRRVIPYETPGTFDTFEVCYVRVLARMAACEPGRFACLTLAEELLAAVRVRRRGEDESTAWPARPPVSVLREFIGRVAVESSGSAMERDLKLLTDLAHAPQVRWVDELARLRLRGFVNGPVEEHILATTLYYADQELTHLT